MEFPIQHDVYIWANYSVSSYLNFIPIFRNVLIWLKSDVMHIVMHHFLVLWHIIFETTAHIPEVEFGGKYGYMRANLRENNQHWLLAIYWTCKNKICDNKRLFTWHFSYRPWYQPETPAYQPRRGSWKADMGRRLIPGTIWKISCHNLFITYFTLTFFKHWLLYCKKDLWTVKLRK
jgi:hypothetical protein